MTKILHINCPKCGGTLGLVGVERIVKCRFCGTWSLVDLEDLVPEYYVRPNLKNVDARREVQRLLKDPDMPGGLLKETQFHSARLYFIPYHEVTGRRLGTMIVTQFKEGRPRPQAYQSMGTIYGGAVTMGLREERAITPRTKEIDTRVVMSDIVRLEPAVKLDEWGLEEADLEALRTDTAGVLQPINRKLMERAGKIYDATLSSKDMLKGFDLKSLTSYLEDSTEIAEIKVKRIFYPVWRVRYRYQGRLYGAAIDAVTGKVMSARAPQDDRNRVLWMLGAAAMVALVAGKIGRGLLIDIIGLTGKAGALIPSGTGHATEFTVFAIGYGLPLIIVLAAAALFVFGIGWEQFRYPGELVIRGKRRRVEKIGRPKETWFDRASKAMVNAAGSMFNQMIKQQRSGY